MEFPIFAYIALLLLAGLFSTRLMKVLKLPNVTGYIITGILMGPFVFGLCFNGFTYEGIKDAPIAQYIGRLSWVSQVALGFIAFSIGTSFKAKTLKAVGKRVLVITFLEAFCASLAVILALLVAHFIFPEQIGWEIVLTLGAIASATAPAATLMVIRQYKARGEIVDTLLPVVALDDAVALILFAILFQIASTISLGSSFDAYKMLLKPILEILISLGLGVGLGFLISLCNKFFLSRNNRLIFCVFTVFAALGFYMLFRQPGLGGFELSSLLICMAAGAIYANFRKDSGPTFDVLDRFTSPIYMMFFVLSGASLDLTIFFSSKGLVVLGIAAVYLFSRVAGKWFGAFTGAALTKSSPEVRKYLGLTLIPQAGVAIGLATTCSALFANNPATKEAGALILAIVLSSTLVYELIGPLITKFALSKAGAIPKEDEA
ncbi:MAG: cation:proton antiporter [Bacilli bacterium]|nr:cation:proton antiporter [Bacilli bacterium]